jgi:hypothetical protein
MTTPAQTERAAQFNALLGSVKELIEKQIVKNDEQTVRINELKTVVDKILQQVIENSINKKAPVVKKNNIKYPEWLKNEVTLNYDTSFKALLTPEQINEIEKYKNDISGETDESKKNDLLYNYILTNITHKDGNILPGIAKAYTAASKQDLKH